MAEPLKNQFGPEVPTRIAAMIRAVHPQFDSEGFVHHALEGYDALELMPRGEKIADSLRHFLPPDYPHAIKILVDSFGSVLQTTSGMGMAPFLYLPHSTFIAKFGLDHFDTSMHAQYELTQRFTAEFSMRPYLEHQPEASLAQLMVWRTDPSKHVRRLVSESTRPRLPWGSRLRAFMQDPGPVLDLLEGLKDDPSLYVRRSVANNLNDIGKDNPDKLLQTAEAWMQNASAERQWLVRHALRSMVKNADSKALSILGYGDADSLEVDQVSIQPNPVQIGGSIRIEFNLHNLASVESRVLADFRVHYIKANGTSSPKVFKLKELTLAAGETVKLGKKVSVADMTTRKHYPGIHHVEVILNGEIRPLTAFELKPS